MAEDLGDPRSHMQGDPRCVHHDPKISFQGTCSWCIDHRTGGYVNPAPRDLPRVYMPMGADEPMPPLPEGASSQYQIETDIEVKDGNITWTIQSGGNTIRVEAPVGAKTDALTLLVAHLGEVMNETLGMFKTDQNRTPPV